MTPEYDPQDDRDLEILKRFASGQEPHHIAQCMRVRCDVVRYVLLRDRAAFPDEPLR